MLKKVAIILGSRSDLPKIEVVIFRLRAEYGDIQIDVHILSCHRNFLEMYKFVFTDKCMGAEAILYCGGMAFAAPGVIKAAIDAAELDIPVYGIALGEEGSVSLDAAVLSIEQLPGTPVILKEDGTAYIGPEGLKEAFKKTVSNNIPETKKNAKKPAEFCIAIG